MKLYFGGFAEVERWHGRLNERAASRQPFPEAKAAGPAPLA